MARSVAAGYSKSQSIFVMQWAQCRCNLHVPTIELIGVDMNTQTMARKVGIISLALLVATAANGQGNEGGKAYSKEQIAQLKLKIVPAANPYFALSAAELNAMKAEKGPNPYLAFLPAEAEPDFQFWQAAMRSDSKNKTPSPSPLQLITANEAEGVGAVGQNDSIATAEHITNFGTRLDEDPAADISGSLPQFPVPATIGPFAEDDGAIPIANVTGLISGAAVKLNGTIGDGPHGSAGTGNGDFDFFEISGVLAGQVIIVDIDTVPATLDPFVAVWNSAGNLLAANDDDEFTFDSYLEFAVPSDGDYFVSVEGYNDDGQLPADPFDSSSGIGVGSEGDYDLTLALIERDVDVYSFELKAGDIVGASVAGGGTRLELFDPSGVLRHGSNGDATSIHPNASPLPGGGNAVVSHVAEVAGLYYLGVSNGSGSYNIALRVFRPVLESDVFGGSVQTLFIDFDGATIDPSIFGGPAGPRHMSPLSAFLGDWGLTPGDEDAVIDAILAAISESLESDLLNTGNNSNFGIQILNSRDHADPFGQRNVSRIIIGGTIAELGIGTIGIADSIDVGNFEANETAIVLLDLLSADSGNPNSLNGITLDPGATIIDLIGIGVGNIAAHEAGHFFGDWHTDQFNAQENIMDQGGNLANTLGLGPDEEFGTIDDRDVDFGKDSFVPNEGFSGTEDTLNTVAFGLMTAELKAVPTLSEWGMIVMGVLIMAGGIRSIRQHGIAG